MSTYSSVNLYPGVKGFPLETGSLALEVTNIPYLLGQVGSASLTLSPGFVTVARCVRLLRRHTIVPTLLSLLRLGFHYTDRELFHPSLTPAQRSPMVVQSGGF